MSFFGKQQQEIGPEQIKAARQKICKIIHNLVPDNQQPTFLFRYENGHWIFIAFTNTFGFNTIPAKAIKLRHHDLAELKKQLIQTITSGR